jgi:hypothetical protein
MKSSIQLKSECVCTQFSIRDSRCGVNAQLHVCEWFDGVGPVTKCELKCAHNAGGATLQNISYYIFLQ